MRAYLAAGESGVRELRETGSLTAPAYVVTAAMRAAEPTADEEDLEYDAARLAEEELRRTGAVVVVVAADVPEACVGEDPRLDVGTVPASSVVSFHVAEHGAPAEEELLWFDASELEDVLAYLDRGR